MESELKEMQESARIFDVQLPDFKQLRACRSELKMLKILWDYVILVRMMFEFWNCVLWAEIDVEQVNLCWLDRDVFHFLDFVLNCLFLLCYQLPCFWFGIWNRRAMLPEWSLDHQTAHQSPLKSFLGGSDCCHHNPVYSPVLNSSVSDFPHEELCSSCLYMLPLLTLSGPLSDLTDH